MYRTFADELKNLVDREVMKRGISGGESCMISIAASRIQVDTFLESSMSDDPRYWWEIEDFPNTDDMKIIYVCYREEAGGD